jgi:hypothetical protein
MRRIVIFSIVFLFSAVVLLPLAGCSLMPKTPELREIVRLTDTPAASDLPVNDQTSGLENNPTHPLQATNTKQPTKQNIEEVGKQPEISISPRTVSQGAKIQIQGRGFPSGAEVRLGFGRVNSEFDLIYKTQATQEGDFKTELEVPEFVNPEDSWVIVAAADNLRIKVFTDPIQFNG